MAHVPNVICGECLVEMRCIKNGVEVEMMLEDNSPYYKAQADKYGCPTCGKEVIYGMGNPYAFHHQENYKNWKVDVQAEFA